MRLHPRSRTIDLQLPMKLLTDVLIFHPVWDRCSTFMNIHRCVVDRLLPRRSTRQHTRMVWTKPSCQTERLVRNIKVLVISTRTTRCSTHTTTVLIVHPDHLITLTILPRIRTQMLGPAHRIALAGQTE